MNHARLLELADAIEHDANRTEGRSFNLNNWYGYVELGDEGPDDQEAAALGFVGDECGCCACIGGYTVALFDGDHAADYSARLAVDRLARDLLELTVDEAESLFYAHGGSVWARLAPRYGWSQQTLGHSQLSEWSQITGHQAAEVLRLVARGEVTL